MHSLNNSVASVLTSLANAPQLKSVPADIADLKREFGQFGSRLTDVETQTTSSSEELKKMQNIIKSMPNTSSKQMVNDVSSKVGFRYCYMTTTASENYLIFFLVFLIYSHYMFSGNGAPMEQNMTQKT